MNPRKRFFKPSKNSFFIFGPRGTGKTYWAQTHYENALWVDLRDGVTYRTLFSEPERLYKWVESNPEKTPIIIDEVQKIPEVLETVHRLIEKFPQKQFIMTGSSARKLRRGGVNLLGGRAANKKMHPYMASELGEMFFLEKSLKLGMLPLVWGAKDPQDALNAYISLYLNEEVQLEGLVRNLGGFSRFLEAISFSQASPLNISNIARQCEIERKTVEGYTRILEDLLLSFKLDIFKKRARRQLAEHPKFFYFDAGVFRSVRPQEFLDKEEEINGPALETLIAQHLRAWCDYSDGKHTLYYWQTRSKVEVDFVLYGTMGLFAFEVKNAKKIKPEHVSSLKTFAQDYPESKQVLLYRGEKRDFYNDVLCLPCEEFLKGLRPNELFRSELLKIL